MEVIFEDSMNLLIKIGISGFIERNRFAKYY
jgi:hypothetical protein